ESMMGWAEEPRALPCQRQLCGGRHVDIKLRYDVPGPQMNLSFLKICDLQQLAIPDPGLCQLSLGLGRSRGIATRLIDLEEPIVGPTVRGGALERALELILRFGKPACLQQRGSERLAHRIVPVGWFRVWQGILDSRGFFETSNRDREIPLRLSDATFDHSARKAHHLLARNPRCLEQREIRRSLEGCDRVSLSHACIEVTLCRIGDAARVAPHG